MKCKYCNVKCQSLDSLCHRHHAMSCAINSDKKAAQEMLAASGYVGPHNYAILIDKKLIAVGVEDAAGVEKHIADMSERQLAGVCIIRYNKIINGLKKKVDL